MKPIEPAALDLSSQGQTFAARQRLLARPTDIAQFQQQTLLTIGSAFALAQYADDQVRSHKARQEEMRPGIQRLQGNTRLLRSSGMEIQNSMRILVKLPFARSVTGIETPRIAGIADAYLKAAKYQWSIPGLSTFFQGYQLEEPLTLRELWASPIALKLVLLEEILSQAAGAFSNLPASDDALDASMLCLHEVSLPVWSNILEPLVPFEPILRDDPAQVYAKMDFDSRDMYRTALSKIAERSPMNEVEVASMALEMARHAARQPNANERVTARCSHIGYYIVDAGTKELKSKCGFRPRVSDRVRSALHSYPDDFYLGAIQTIALVVIAAILIPLVPLYNPLGALAIAFLFLLLPVSQGAVELVNHTVTALLKPQALAKLDFSEGLPADCKTLVAVPTLLLNEKQVRELVAELEVRCLANQDPNIHYALLTDLPDSTEKPRERDIDPLVTLAGQLIDELNHRYAGSRGGRFLMLHRHRIFNPRQGVWMGWERKRGKLLDLNRLIMGGADCFPFKAGDVSVLEGMRYVLTLDSDTKLPRDSVRRMVGAMAHPLNRAILDPRRRIVTQGYGIMQPRVGITVHSVARSRLAAIYSGQTGFDIYTRAISDVYQDLYGEGIFTGKGLYEIQILHEVLDRRFPQNSLLSHDLIEGAYARVGLLTDVEVMDDYPSHYSAQNRRKHRWVRGDWQIMRWLLGRVPNESGHSVPNPTSTVSRWKIFDNLRRSLVEPATFLLLVIGWLWLPGTPGYWTRATLLIVFVPVFVQFVFSMVRASVAEQGGYVRQSLRDSLGLLFSTALNFAFLAHQTLLMLDAILRSLVRSFVTGERLLEWETAAEAEMGHKKETPVEITMRLVPLLSLAVALLVLWVRPKALPWALPILVLWALTKPITLWLNRSPHDLEPKLTAKDIRFLRKVAWRTWLYFVQYVGPHNHGLVPDNVQEEGHVEASRLSPTNAGLQLNARQAAVVMGYLTLPEYAQQTLANLRTLEQIVKWKGHLLNWYTTTTLENIKPLIASSVDSGNFLASLCSLTMGTLETLRTPLLPNLREGLLDVVNDTSPPTDFEQNLKRILQSGDMEWLNALLTLDVPQTYRAKHTGIRVMAVVALVQDYLPWLQPRFRAVLTKAKAEDKSLDFYTPQTCLDYCHTLLAALAAMQPEDRNSNAAMELEDALHASEHRLTDLASRLNEIAELSERMFQETDFRVMLDPYRRLLSIGYDTENDRLLNSCYDLLASEARTAMFLAIGKGDVLQESWFRVARKTTMIDGIPVLMSWSGTMFEYMMPTLWMQTSPETLLAQSLPLVVTAQRQFIGRRRMPWGISEASHSERDPQGNYQYHAFGVPTLALNPPPKDFLVIAPYATVLALEADRGSALANLYEMEKMGWLGEFGFYESADYSATTQHPAGSKYTLVRSWMAHHQGMSLLAITNLLADKPFQRWFHADPRVRATELLLHEKPAQTAPPQDVPRTAGSKFNPAQQMT
ncbi:MAG TPA: glucoamylase family protein [Acidobacteriaceae bacterium]|nr:glucoamylase family protein [Acidobacteriaceae bacterium]